MDSGANGVGMGARIGGYGLPPHIEGSGFTLVVTNAQLVNVLTGECYPVDVATRGAWIVAIGPVGSCVSRASKMIDARGRFLSPGLIDVHVHIESSMLTPAQFAAAVLPRGTTTVVADPHEIANVLGLDGVNYMLEASAGLPLDVFFLAPSCVPAVPSLETAGAEFGIQEIKTILSWPRVIGLAEVMDYPGVINGDARVTAILREARRDGGLICGHCPELRGHKLQTYMAAGPDSDHEVLDGDELLEKLRLGITVEAHASFHSENISTLVAQLSRLPLLPPNAAFCIDDLHAATLIEDGHMDRVLRAAVQHGLPPVTALRLATIQGAMRSRLHHLGVIAPGRLANFVLFDDLNEFRASHVIYKGILVARDGKLLQEIPSQPLQVESRATVHLERLPDARDFRLRAGGDLADVHVIELVHDTAVTRLGRRVLPVRDGSIQWDGETDLCQIAVFERHGRRGTSAHGFISGYGLRNGALASTVAHDSHNIIVLGRNPDDMALATRELVRMGGGMVCTAWGKVLAAVALPVAGLLSNHSPEELTRELRHLSAVVRELGAGGRDPLMGITNLALPVIPDVRITDLGLVDVAAQQLIPLFV